MLANIGHMNEPPGEWMTAFEGALGYAFVDKSLLERAITHSSFANESPRSQPVVDNETLEFLGDSILNFLVAEMLLEALPDAREGVLSKARSHLVSEGHFAEMARRLGIGSVLRLAPSESRAGGRLKESLLADAFEAVVAAVYRDGGMELVRELVRRFFRDDIASLNPAEITFRDHKTALQEFAQAAGKPLPVYRLVSESGPDHEKRFVFEVEFEGAGCAVGEGPTKKEAQRRAAKALLELLGRDSD
jgi:ribonuclease III